MSLGKSAPHDSARGHVTGQSIFVDDRPFLQGEVQVFVKGAPAAAGTIKNIDFQEALKIPGVLGVWTARDLYHNKWGTIVQEQPILVDGEIGYMDEPVCLVASETKEAGLEALKKIRIEVQERVPVLSLNEAIQKKQFLYQSTPFVTGDADKALAAAPHRLSGTFVCGGQEHFYMESQASVVYPLENDCFEVHSSSQHPTETQHVVAEALGVAQSQVVCIVKRMGGGFGGKESQAAPFAAMAGLVAQKLGRPARIVLSKDDDMKFTGKRHPFQNEYEVGFDQDGRLLAIKAKLYADAGAYTDLSPSILDRALFHLDGAYFLPNAKIEGWACRTNNHSNTAFRGFGGPQGNMTIESIFEDIAHVLKKDAFDIRRLNVYGPAPRNKTPYGQDIEDLVLPELFQTLEQEASYRQRRQDVDQFNSQNSGKLRGLSVTAVKFGIAFTARHLNQANALVNLHRDGTLQVSTGATEMGQGVNTKIAQTVATALGVPSEAVKVMSTSTEKNANTSPTAASSGSDLNCSAALKASLEITRRLAWVAEHLRTKSLNELRELSAPPGDFVAQDFVFRDSQVVHEPTGWSEDLVQVIQKAYLHRLSLSEYAHFRTKNLGFDKKTGKGRAFSYFTNGICASEVEIDEDTGELKVRRVDLLMDLGCSMNPAIDLGQVTGAFVQGMGWVTSENLYYSPQGHLISHSPTTYKIPNVQDCPRVFNVRLIANTLNSHNVFSTKAVGEPPLLLGSSVWTAVKNALSYRAGPKPPNFVSPATPEVILLECMKYGSQGSS
ncbi:MAG: xanthine dehydrogenase molybdopterin binding subunit [Bdellovibrio sp.]